MANRHFYFSFENLALVESDWIDLVERFRQRGSANNGDNPAERNHQRERLDGQAIIYEALFNENAVNANAVRGILTSITGVTPKRISYDTVAGDNLVTTYTLDGVDSLIQSVFGINGATWQESRVEVISYLAENSEEWEAAEEWLI